MTQQHLNIDTKRAFLFRPFSRQKMSSIIYIVFMIGVQNYPKKCNFNADCGAFFNKLCAMKLFRYLCLHYWLIKSLKLWLLCQLLDSSAGIRYLYCIGMLPCTMAGTRMYLSATTALEAMLSVSLCSSIQTAQQVNKRDDWPGV